MTDLSREIFTPLNLSYLLLNRGAKKNLSVLIAFGTTLHKCERELKSSLEGWLIARIRYGDELPVIGKINLNERMPQFQGEAAAVHV